MNKIMSFLRTGTILTSSRAVHNGILRSQRNLRNASSTSGREEAVVLTDDGKTIVAWHPEPHVPYEMTMPLPEQSKSDTILKSENTDAVKKLFKSQHPFFVRKELQELTFTTKQFWRPMPGKRYAKKNPPRDREYL